MGIIHACLHFLLGVFAPGSGRRRASAAPVTPASVRRTQGAHPTRSHARQVQARGQTARPRSPYGLVERIDGEGTALIRPYLVECERQEERARQRWRRLSLVMAADFGIDLDSRDVHGAGVAW